MSPAGFGGVTYSGLEEEGSPPLGQEVKPGGHHSWKALVPVKWVVSQPGKVDGSIPGAWSCQWLAYHCTLQQVA